MNKNIITIVFTVALVNFGFTNSALADRCDPKMLAKLPEKKRQMIEKRCALKASKPAYTISNKGKEASEKMPQNNYSGADLNQLLSKIKIAWKNKHPKDKVLAVKITSKDWKRDVNFKSNSTSIYKNDTSILGGKVIVETNDKLATIFPAFINKDNLSGEVNIGVATKKSNYVIKQMLVSNVN